MSKTNGIYAASHDELEEMMRLVDRLNSTGLDVFLGWFKTSENGIAINPRSGIILLSGYAL